MTTFQFTIKHDIKTGLFPEDAFENLLFITCNVKAPVDGYQEVTFTIDPEVIGPGEILSVAYSMGAMVENRITHKSTEKIINDSIH